MSDLTIAGVSFEQIRLSQMDNGDPLFCARDVMDVLGMSPKTMVTAFLGELELEAQADMLIEHSSGSKATKFITLAGVFYCCSKCRANPRARELDKWARNKAAEVALGKQGLHSLEIKAHTEAMARTLLDTCWLMMERKFTPTSSVGWAIRLDKWLQGYRGVITTKAVCTALGEKITSHNRMLAAKHLRAAGYRKHKAIVSGHKVYVWEPISLTATTAHHKQLRLM